MGFRIKKIYYLYIVCFLPFCLLYSQRNIYTFADTSGLLPLKGLANPFIKPDSSYITSKKEWKEQREYLKEMLAYYQYGRMPSKPDSIIIEKTLKLVDDKQEAVTELINLILRRNGKRLSIRLGIYRPDKEARFPVIIQNDVFRFDSLEIADINQRKRYKEAQRFEIQEFVLREVISRGYVLCKFIRTDIALDHNNNRESGVFALYPEYDWGTIAAWAWGYQVILDFLAKENYIDISKVVATGHSRGGKTALCAGIYDDRIFITAPNSSGTGGTGSWRFFDQNVKADRRYYTRSTEESQTLLHHRKVFPYWWSNNLFQFVGQEEKIPFDAHTAKILIAPRALINTHARHDYWANPYGTYLTYLAAQPVFDWLGVGQLNVIHWRDGGHNQNEEDWSALFDYCDLIFFNKKTDRLYNNNPYPDLYDFDGWLPVYSTP
jgi:hypothetical protein